jgi:predicted dehydrogenase
MILPHFGSFKDLSLETICTARGMNAEALAQRYKFRKATTDAAEIFDDAQINAVAVATRHDSHAGYAYQALAAGKSVYVEKPLAMNEEQLAPIVKAIQERESGGPTLWVGYNRRFSPMSVQAMSHMEGVPVRQIVCTVRSSSVPADSWYQDPAEGGGILFGDVCHFIDLAIWFQRSLPVEIHAFATRDPGHREESWAIQMRFANGGLSTVNYVCGNQQGWERETIDVLGGGKSARISGFRNLTLNGAGRSRKSSSMQPDLGQKAMIEAMIAQFNRAKSAIDHTESFIVATQALLATQRSIQEQRVVFMNTHFPYDLT